MCQLVSINALGTETTGAFRFWRPGEVPPSTVAAPPREATRDELKQRLSERDAIPLAVWDGKVRMFGDAFSLEDVGAFQLADFAKRCNVDRRLLKREAARLAKLATGHAAAQALADDYADDEERAFASRLRDFIVGQAARLTGLAGDAAKMGDEFL